MNQNEKEYYYLILENGRIITKYDSYMQITDMLPDFQECIKVDKEEGLPLPLEWYESTTCPEYIRVTSPSTFDRSARDLGRTTFLDTKTTTENNVVSFDIALMHSAYTHIKEGSGLTSSNIVSGSEAVDRGVDDLSKDVIVRINEKEYEAVMTKGHVSISIDWEYGNNSTVLIQLVDKENEHIISEDSLEIDLPLSVKEETARTSFIEERNRRLSQCDWIITRHISQKMISDDTTLSEEEVKEVARYMQELRDMPLHIEHYRDTEIVWPEVPETVTQQ